MWSWFSGPVARRTGETPDAETTHHTEEGTPVFGYGRKGTPVGYRNRVESGEVRYLGNLRRAHPLLVCRVPAVYRSSGTDRRRRPTSDKPGRTPAPSGVCGRSPPVTPGPPLWSSLWFREARGPTDPESLDTARNLVRGPLPEPPLGSGTTSDLTVGDSHYREVPVPFLHRWDPLLRDSP